jgi:hypothetical protein
MPQSVALLSRDRFGREHLKTGPPLLVDAQARAPSAAKMGQIPFPSARELLLSGRERPISERGPAEGLHQPTPLFRRQSGGVATRHDA